VGADAVSVLARRHAVSLRVEKGTRATAATFRTQGRLVALAIPSTYMNESGLAVASLARRYGVEDPHRILVVHDELDLPAGRVKVKVGGGTAGHNGLKSIHAHLHSPDYLRVRIGVGKPPGRQSGADYVLRRPGGAEREVLEGAVARAADTVELIAAEGVEVAMNQVNAEP
jgi:PTH1 family peptidyl-tRNA hydrolase